MGELLMAFLWSLNGIAVLQDGLALECESCPCGCVKIPSRQISGQTPDYGIPHYRLLLAEKDAVDFSYALYATGYADDCLEVVDGSGNVLFTDHDPDIDGVTHRYENKLLCGVPANTAVKIYLWDTAYIDVRWNGSFCYIRIDLESEDFE